MPAAARPVADGGCADAGLGGGAPFVAIDGQGNLRVSDPPNVSVSLIIANPVTVGPNGGSFVTIVNTVGTDTKYSDGTAIDARAIYAYRVSATNASGTGPASNVVTPALPALSWPSAYPAGSSAS